MDAIREQMEKPLVFGVVAFIVGLLIGWFLLGWVLFPVQFTGAAPRHLHEAAQDEYLRMAMQAYAATGDAQTARARFEALGDDADAVLERVMTSPNTPANAQDFIFVVGGEPPVVPTTEPPAEEEGGGIFSSLLPILCFGILLVAAAAIVFLVMRNRSITGAGVRPSVMSPVQQAQEAARQATWTDYAAEGEEPPIAQFMASYKVGDDLFDDSFSIDSPVGEFLGECGVGISETIGVGDPKKVTAFEVWLFDKNDIQTVTKVLMSSHAYMDEATRQRLEAKGEPVMVEPGAETVLETETLQMVARVVEMSYGEGALPPESFFDQFIIELAVWGR